MTEEYARADVTSTRARTQGRTTVVPILLYHDVSDTPGDSYAVSHATFARHMEAVAASGRRPLTVDAYVDALAHRSPMPDRPVLVTFDDGYLEFPTAVATMSTAGVEAATLYVTTGHAEQPGRSRWSELAALPAWVQLGAHSRTHPQLDLLPPDRLVDEVRGSRTDLEQRLGRACTSFAYPHGHHDRAVRESVVEAGYSSACAVKNALSHTGDDAFALARVTITAATTDQQLDALLQGRGAPVAWRRERLRTKAFRVYRRRRGGAPTHV